MCVLIAASYKVLGNEISASSIVNFMSYHLRMDEHQQMFRAFHVCIVEAKNFCDTDLYGSSSRSEVVLSYVGFLMRSDW